MCVHGFKEAGARQCMDLHCSSDDCAREFFAEHFRLRNIQWRGVQFEQYFYRKSVQIRGTRGIFPCYNANFICPDSHDFGYFEQQLRLIEEVFAHEFKRDVHVRFAE
jgi:hypothetical protein